MTRIGIDIDGVVYNFVNKLRDYIHQTTGRPLEEMPSANTWLFFDEQWGYSLAEYLDLIEQGVKDKEIFWRGELYPNAVWGVNELYKRYDLVFITARGYHGIAKECEQATRYWLDSNGFNYNDIIIDSDKTKHDIDILIDDAPENYFHRSQAGLKTLVFNQPWNEHLHDAPRVNGWIEAVEYIKENFPTESWNLEIL